MTEELDALAQVADLLRDVAQVGMAGLDDDTLCGLAGRVEQAGRLLDTLRVLSAAEVEDRSRFELGNAGLASRHGHRRGVHFLEELTRVSQAEAARRIRLGAAIAPRAALDGHPLPGRFPKVADAMLNGRLGVDAAGQIVRCLTQATRHATLEGLDAAETALVDAGSYECADLVGTRARVWREYLDPDGAELRDAEIRDRRSCTIGRERNGITPVVIGAEPVLAARLRAAFAEHTAPGVTPRYLTDEDTLRGTEGVITPEGQVVERVRDPRSREQRQYDVLTGILTAGLRSTDTPPGGMRSLSTVMAVIRAEDLQKGTGVGWLDDVDEAVSATTVSELACDAGVQKVLLGGDGEVLALGPRVRYFTGSQRKALAVRDGGCVWPHCTAPPSWCDAHHVTEYDTGGPTTVDNGALLCSAHHHMLHSSEFIMRMIRGKPMLLAPPWLDPDQMWRPLGKARVAMTAHPDG